tara:strand:+ start:393 stop:524 length:132 start_codon:yes stop_codon:yes gene_type:complete
MDDLTYLATAYLTMIGLLGAWAWTIMQRLENLEKGLFSDTEEE